MILATVNDKLQIVLAGAITTNQLQWDVSYADHTTTTFTPGSARGLTNNTTDTDMVAAPAASTQRQVKTINVYNNDTVDATVIIKTDSTGTDRIFIRKVLAPNQSLFWSQETGWGVFPNANTSIVNTDDVPEGSVNKYFTSTRATQAVSAKFVSVNTRIATVSAKGTSINTRLVNLSATLENRLSTVSALAGSGGYNDALISARITSVNENTTSALNRIATVSGKLTSVNENVVSAYGRLNVVSARITSINSRVATVSTKLTSVNENATSALNRIIVVSGKLTSVNSKLTTTSARITSVNENTTSALSRIATVSGKLTSVNARVANVSNNIYILKAASVKNATFTVSNKTRYPVDTSAGLVSINLPTGVPNKYIVGFFDAKGSWATNNFRIRSTGNILLGTSILECDINHHGIELYYTSLTGWRMVI